MSNNNLDFSLIKNVLKSVYIDDKNLDIIQADLVSNIYFKDNNLNIIIEFEETMVINQQNIQSQIKAVIKNQFPNLEVRVIFSSHKKPVENIPRTLPNIKRIILMAATKGGVGKSTTSVNVALAVAKLGFSVGIVDADIYGPTLPRLLGVDQKPDTKDGKMLPIKKHGIYSISMGYIVEESQAAMWRGPMVSKALYQLLIGVAWPELDFLFIDMPPGTGDIYLSLAKNFSVDGVVLITTPQNIAFSMLQKSVSFFERTNIPILGVIENMSYYISNNIKHNIFGESVIKNSDYKLLGEIPIIPKISEFSDKGLSLKQEQEFIIYDEIAQNILKVLNF